MTQEANLYFNLLFSKSIFIMLFIPEQASILYIHTGLKYVFENTSCSLGGCYISKSMPPPSPKAALETRQ